MIEKSRQRPTLPPGCPDSTIGAGGLNGRVRNGNGCGPSAMVTGMNFMKPTTTEDPEARRGNQPCRLQGVFRQTCVCGRPHLGVGFTLRCFQRLSQPNLATQLCLWRDNWCTRGSSIPVL